MSSRALALALCSLAIGGPALGCGSGEPATPTPDQQGAADPAAFPVEIEHQLGTTKIARPPQRIVTVGLRDQDFVLALGVTPVGTTEWFGDQPGAVWPWAEQSVDGSAPEVVGEFSDLNYEAISRLDPDLILGVYSGMTDRTYETLSRIAPTIADPPGYADYTVPWQEQLRITAEALGRTDQAERIAAETEAAIAGVRERHPEWAGQTAVYGGLGGQPGIYTSTDQRGRLLESLGLDVPSEIDELAPPSDAYFAEISREDFRLFDQDAVIVISPTNDPASLPEQDSLYGRLDAYSEGRIIAIDELGGLLSGSLSFDSPLSIPYSLEQLEPRLETALDGDPSTEVEPTAPIPD